jgi:hypothetical protein
LILIIGAFGFFGLFFGVRHYFVAGDGLAPHGVEYWLAASGVGMVGFSCFAGWILLLDAVHARMFRKTVN